MQTRWTQTQITTKTEYLWSKFSIHRLKLRRWKKNACQVIKPTSYFIIIIDHLTPYFFALAPPDSDDDNVPIVKTIVDLKRKSNFVGMKVARDFGQTSVYIGEVVDLEYDLDDVGQEAPFYVVQYTDGDREDMDEDEFIYALDFF